MAIVQVSIVPLGTGTSSVSRYVARAVSVLEEERDITYQLTSMGTIVEGDLDRVLSIVRRMHECVFGEKVRRIVTTLTIDDRRDKTSTMKSKVNSVLDKLHRS